MMDVIPLKRDYDTGDYGFVETFTPKTYARGWGFKLRSAVAPTPDGRIQLAEAYFYFGELFTPLEYYIKNRDIEGYIRARKPSHVLFKPAESLPVDITLKVLDGQPKVIIHFLMPTKASTPKQLVLSDRPRPVPKDVSTGVDFLCQEMLKARIANRKSFLLWRGVNHA